MNRIDWRRGWLIVTNEYGEVAVPERQIVEITDHSAETHRADGQTHTIHRVMIDLVGDEVPVHLPFSQVVEAFEAAFGSHRHVMIGNTLIPTISVRQILNVDGEVTFTTDLGREYTYDQPWELAISHLHHPSQ